MSIPLLTAVSHLRSDWVAPGSVHLHLENLQEQSLCSISEQPVPLPVSPCGKNNFLSCEALFFQLMPLISHSPALQHCDQPDCTYSLTSPQPQEAAVIFHEVMPSPGCTSPGPPASYDRKFPLLLPAWRPGSFPQSCSLNRKSSACKTERCSFIPGTGLASCHC